MIDVPCEGRILDDLGLDSETPRDIEVRLKRPWTVRERELQDRGDTQDVRAIAVTIGDQSDPNAGVDSTNVICEWEVGVSNDYPRIPQRS